MGGTAIPDRSVWALAIAGVGLVIALCCLYASASRDELHEIQPLPANLIKCACWPDPAMQRLGFPQPLPDTPPQSTPPQLVPSR